MKKLTSNKLKPLYMLKQLKMKKIHFLYIVFLGFLACTATRVKNTEAAPGFALSNYKTFNFYEITTNGEPVDAEYQDRINILKNSIQQELITKGLTLNPTNPDLLVNIGVVTTEKVQTRQTNFREDAPRYIGQRRYTWQSREVEVGRYKQGTVTIDLVDPGTNAMVWQGSAEAAVPNKNAKLQKTAEEGVKQLFAEL